MRFCCGGCGYEFSTVRGAPREDTFYVVDDYAADGFYQPAAFGPLSDGSVHGASALDAMGAVPVFLCPDCGALVFPFGRAGRSNEGQPVETYRKGLARPPGAH